MKLNLSINSEEYKNRVQLLKRKLDRSRESGILEEGFQEELRDLVKMEERLLEEMVPYYRAYGNNTKKTSMEINSIKELGAFSFNSILQNIFRISEGLFIVSGLDGRVQFFHINSLDGEGQVEWSPHIEEINERISFIHKLNNREILLLGVKAGGYLISIEDPDKLPNVKEDIQVRRIKTNHGLDRFRGYGRVIEIGENLFLTDDGRDRLNLFELIRDKDEDHLIFHKDSYCLISNFTVMQQIRDNYFLAGSKDGNSYLVEYENKEFKILEKMNIFKDRIRKINYLEGEKASRESLMVVGDRGKLSYLSLNKDMSLEARELGLEKDELQGNLFDISSQGSTALVLSENGIIYLFEENFGHWTLNKDASIKDMFFIHVSQLSKGKYLLMDIKGKLYSLSINGIYTPEDLWKMPIY